MDYTFSERFDGLESNAIRAIFKLLHRPEIISFAGGIPSTDCLPISEISEITRVLLSGKDAGKILQYGATEGYAPLLESGADYLLRKGIHAQSSENLFVVNGGQQAIDLVCKAFLNKGDVVLVESPTYLAALHIIKTYEGRAVGVASAEDGIDLADLEDKIIHNRPKFLYLVPTFGNPTGRTLPLEKRKKLIALLQKYRLVLLEDDPYGELRYAGDSLPAVRSLDTEGNVIYVASFSKTVSPGLRVALVSADRQVIQKLNLGKQATDVHTSLLSQAIVDAYLKRGCFDTHLTRILPVYREKRDAMLLALARYFPSSVRYTKPQGGLFFFAELPEGVDTEMLFQTAVAQNVAFVPGRSFFAENQPKNTLRLNFSNSSLQEIEQGMSVLGRLITETLVQ